MVGLAITTSPQWKGGGEPVRAYCLGQIFWHHPMENAFATVVAGQGP